MNWRIAIGALFVLAASTEGCPAADPRYPDWPCVPANVAEISLAAVWAGPPLAAVCARSRDPAGDGVAACRHVRATSAASLRCRLSPSTIRVGGVSLAREQRRLAAIVTADVVGYSHAAYEQIYYSSLMPRTYLCVRLLERLD